MVAADFSLRPAEAKMKKQTKFPPGWDEARVHWVLAHHEEQTEEEAVAEDEAAFEYQSQTAMEAFSRVKKRANSALLFYVVPVRTLYGGRGRQPHHK